MYADFLELIRLHGLLTHTTGCDIKMITVVVSYADIAITTGNPVASICFNQGIAYGF
jgi:hypothetical protein